MGFAKKYVEYLKDNPHEYWFKRKVFGWGWMPVRWQGWLVILSFFLVVIYFGSEMGAYRTSPGGDIAWFIVKIALAAAALIFIAYMTGEKPKWQWGFPDEKEEKGSEKGIK
jgi:hypothetical protein